MSSLEFGPENGKLFPQQILADLEKGVPLVTAIRRWRGLSIDQVAELAGIKSVELQAIEDGFLYDRARMEKVAQVLGVPTDLIIE